MKSDCHGAEMIWDGIVGEVCAKCVRKCQPAEPREAKEEHPGRWPTQAEVKAAAKDIGYLFRTARCEGGAVHETHNQECEDAAFFMYDWLRERLGYEK